MLPADAAGEAFRHDGRRAGHGARAAANSRGGFLAGLAPQLAPRFPLRKEAVYTFKIEVQFILKKI